MRQGRQLPCRELATHVDTFEEDRRLVDDVSRLLRRDIVDVPHLPSQHNMAQRPGRLGVQSSRATTRHGHWPDYSPTYSFVKQRQHLGALGFGHGCWAGHQDSEVDATPNIAAHQRRPPFHNQHRSKKKRE